MQPHLHSFLPDYSLRPVIDPLEKCQEEGCTFTMGQIHRHVLLTTQRMEAEHKKHKAVIKADCYLCNKKDYA